MAANMDKGLYQAPQGIEAAVQDQPDIEIEIVDPESVKINGEEILPEEEALDFSINLAEDMEPRELQIIMSDLAGEIRNDLDSRKEWESMLKEGVTLLGLKYEERTEPWPGACGVFHPMITEAVIRFQSETITESFPAAGPVKTKIVGKQTKEKDEAASRVAEDMNWQLTDNMTEFRPEHERMLFSLPGSGSAFKKVYRDPALDRQTSVFVAAEDIILPYGTSEMLTCPRITHRMRKTKQEILRFQQSGFWLDVEIGDPPKVTTELQQRKDKEMGISPINDNRYVIYESCTDIDLPGFEDKDEDGEPTGIALPYIITYIDGINQVLSIRRNWKEGDKTKQKRLHYAHYQYIPGFGAYGFGLFHLIGGFAKSATSLMRQLVDAGTLSNLPGGLKSRGLRIKGDDTPIAPGEFRDVDIGSGAIRDNILPLPYKEPSAVLAGLLEKIIEEGRRFASSSDANIADMSNQAPVGSTLAILERTLKVMTAVQARVHYSFKQELRLIADIVRDDSPANEEYEYDVDAAQGRKAKYEDYRHVEIIPVSDPNASTMSQRVVQYQAVLQLSQSAPQIYDLPELHKQILHVLGIKNIEKLIPTAKDQKPVDPVQENQNVLTGKPVKAFAYQDHEAHIKVHTAAAQDPQIQQLIGQNPQAQVIQGALMAHITEHVGYAYRNKMSQALGVPLPDSEEGLTPEMEYQFSQLLAQAAPQVLAQSQALVAQKQAQQNAQDPIIQMQQQELEIKKQDVERKAKKDMLDAAAKADELKLREQQEQNRMELEGTKLGIDVKKQQAQVESQQHIEGTRMGVDIAKHKEQLKVQSMQQAQQARQRAQQKKGGTE